MDPPSTPEALRAFLRSHLDIDPAPGPLAYLCDALFTHEDGVGEAGPRDCVVWANRGGGKTFCGALATLLDMLFKPGIEVKILAGSLEQAGRMHEHLRSMLLRDALADMVDGRITARHARLVNGSRVELLAQSHTSVRGSRPQVLRCDEVDLFEPGIWQAAQLVTRSAVLGGRLVPGRVEALSTWHEPGGLMESLIEEARGQSPTRTLHRWTVLDVLERCPQDRPCEGCALEDECAGVAKDASGHVLIDDAISLKRRVSRETWESEMLCEGAKRSASVYPGFDPAVHVRDFDPPAGGRWVAGMDFGYADPTVVLYACVDASDVLWVVDEYVCTQRIMEEHVDAIRSSPWPVPEVIGCDPAGRQRNAHTGEHSVALLERAGLACVTPRAPVAMGVRAVGARLRPASGPVRLFVHRRCEHLVSSLRRARTGEDGLPVKDGTDHACDALRYLVCALDRPPRSRVTLY